MCPSSESAPEASVILPVPLHARPAGRLAQLAARFRSAVEIEYGGRAVKVTGVLAVMSLGAATGSAVVVRAEGDDAAEAVRSLAQMLAAAE